MSNPPKCFIPDNLHINERNFGSFFKVARELKFDLIFHDKRRDMIANYGKYRHVRPIAQLSELLQGKPEDELLSLEVNGVNLFDCCCAELLSYLMTTPDWYSAAMPESRELIFNKAYQLNRADLLANMAAAMDWVGHWTEALEGYPGFDYCCVFSGSLIYQRTLIELMKTTKTRVFVLESSFTGNDFYCEERYSPIANHSDIRFRSVYSSYELPDDPTLYERERNKALNKYILSNNKNVQQPEEGDSLDLDFSRKTVVILGQVLNDFSLIETGISSVHFYLNLITELLAHDLNIIFKAHPWEEKKSNVIHPLTYNVLSDFVETLAPNQRDRIRIVDHYPITELFVIADSIVGINSQSLLESCFFGFKPLQFGSAFFGKKGFTHDMSVEDLPAIAGQLADGSLNTKLTMAELRSFEQFITRFFQKHLVSIHKSGHARLRLIFAPRLNVPLIDRPARKKSRIAPLSMPTTTTGSSGKLSPMAKKLRKLERDPYGYFRDAKSPLLRKMKVFFYQR